MFVLLVAIGLLIIAHHYSGMMKLVHGGKVESLHGKHTKMRWATRIDAQTLKDAAGTALTHYNVTIGTRPTEYMTFTPQEFDAAQVQNHRARLGASLDEMFPIHDRPRGNADVDSVLYWQTHKASPVALLRLQDGQLVTLDGVHRVIAAYLTDSKIRAAIFNHT